CPAGLDPQHLWKCLRKGFIEEAQSHGLSRCLECGLCSYACPSKIELAQDFRVARGKASRSGKGEGR
ncbi:4Fe-4S dicluster domain-containing protein, partial [Myxococcota bacterium]|nr:4Fe-4S dicluster domain-containing protein [Myxococcota bacterium]MBU1509753.1 4Fe-4S dicluster domain-containing protein [Myxococcota bacterium]